MDDSEERREEVLRRLKRAVIGTVILTILVAKGGAVDLTQRKAMIDTVFSIEPAATVAAATVVAAAGAAAAAAVVGAAQRKTMIDTVFSKEAAATVAAAAAGAAAAALVAVQRKTKIDTVFSKEAAATVSEATLAAVAGAGAAAAVVEAAQRKTEIGAVILTILLAKGGAVDLTQRKGKEVAIITVRAAFELFFRRQETRKEALIREGKARETKLQEINRGLQEELEQEKIRSTLLREKVMEQEIGSAQLREKVMQQEIELKKTTRLPRYQMSSRPRGICVILNNINFLGRHVKRDGAELDEDGLKQLFTELQFTVHIFRDLQRDEMWKVALDFSKKDHSQFDAFVFIVMSHGGDKDIVYGLKGRHARIEDLMSEFKAANCPTLRNKPKLFIIQTCRGPSNESLSPSFGNADTGAVFSSDSTLARSVCPQEADFLLSFATAPGYRAWRYRGFGSSYIQFLVKAIREYHYSHHLIDILTEVNRRVVEDGIQNGGAIQCPAPTHTLRAQVYL